MVRFLPLDNALKVKLQLVGALSPTDCLLSPIGQLAVSYILLAFLNVEVATCACRFTLSPENYDPLMRLKNSFKIICHEHSIRILLLTNAVKFESFRVKRVNILFVVPVYFPPMWETIIFFHRFSNPIEIKNFIHPFVHMKRDKCTFSS